MLRGTVISLCCDWNNRIGELWNQPRPFSWQQQGWDGWERDISTEREGERRKREREIEGRERGGERPCQTLFFTVVLAKCSSLTSPICSLLSWMTKTSQTESLSLFSKITVRSFQRSFGLRRHFPFRCESHRLKKTIAFSEDGDCSWPWTLAIRCEPRTFMSPIFAEFSSQCPRERMSQK